MKWYDPISERWIEHKEKLPEPIIPTVEDIYEKARQAVREIENKRIWEAVLDVCQI